MVSESDCENFKKLYELDLSHNLISYISPQIFMLSKINILRLSENELVSIPDEIC